jgi:hypothetical protein
VAFHLAIHTDNCHDRFAAAQAFDYHLGYWIYNGGFAVRDA